MKRKFGSGVYTVILSLFNFAAAVVATVLYFSAPSSFNVLKPGEFFARFSPLHLIWAVWAVEIIVKFLPLKPLQSSGADKMFRYSFVSSGRVAEGEAYQKFRKKSRYQVLMMALLWGGCVSICGGLTLLGFFNRERLFLLCAWLYVFDNFFLSLDCPFRVFIMHNRCCKTCRIHNWDRLMTLSPLFFVPGFYTLSLIIPSAVLMIIWEATYLIHPERFWEGSNSALRCSNCTAKTCEHYLDR